MLIVAAVAAPAALTVMNPVHVAGTLIVANTMEDQQSQAFGRLFAIAVGCSVIAPGILSAIAIAAVAQNEAGPGALSWPGFVWRARRDSNPQPSDP